MNATEWMTKAAMSCARKIWPGAARDADAGKVSGLHDIAELTGRIADEFARHAPADQMMDTVREALEALQAAARDIAKPTDDAPCHRGITTKEKCGRCSRAKLIYDTIAKLVAHETENKP